jgi:hypothetical protein
MMSISMFMIGARVQNDYIPKLLPPSRLVGSDQINHANTGSPTASAMFLKLVLTVSPAFAAADELVVALVVGLALPLALLLALLLAPPLLRLLASKIKPPCAFDGAVEELVPLAADWYADRVLAPEAAWFTTMLIPP